MNPLLYTLASGLALHAPEGLVIEPCVLVEPADQVFIVPQGGTVIVPASLLPAHIVWQWRDSLTPDQEWDVAGVGDVDLNGRIDGDDLARFFADLACGCGSADFDNDGDVGTDADIAAFFASL